MTTLYRKHRPQNFKEVVNQNHIKLTLQHEIESGKTAHAYLFSGPRGVGKTTLARVFAKSINCLKRKPEEHEPCNECDSCVEISAGRSLDIIEIDAASHTGVDNVRENIISVSKISNSKSKFKVFIIDEVHMLSTSAFNALLKTLEEPPANVKYILCTTEAHKIPATIISRCERFDFKRISTSELTKKLQYICRAENIKVDIKILEAIARQSEGHMRDAESLLGQVVAIGGQEITEEEADLVIPRSNLGEAINLIGFLAAKDAGSAISLVGRLLDDGIDLRIFCKDLIELLRKIMLIKINPSLGDRLGMELGESIEIKLGEASRDLELRNVIYMVERFIKARNELKSSFVPQLPLEIAIVESVMDKPVATASMNIANTGQLNRPAPVAPVVQAAPAQPVAQGNIDRQVIMSKWSEVLAKIKKYNHSLTFVLRACQPKDVRGNSLCLTFKYKFHKDRINEVTIKNTIEQVLKEVYGTNLQVVAEIDEGLEVSELSAESVVPAETTEEAKPAPDAGADGNVLDSIIKNFGGKVVN